MYEVNKDGNSVISLLSSRLTPEETEKILNLIPDGPAEPTVGDYEEYTVILPEDIKKKIELAVWHYRVNIGIMKIKYDYKCSRIANITSAIPRHSDSTIQSENKIRDFVVVTYLTKFEMGEILFPQHSIFIKPEQGDIIIFPTGPFHQHLVNPAIGRRIIMRSEFIRSEDDQN